MAMIFETFETCSMSTLNSAVIFFKITNKQEIQKVIDVFVGFNWENQRRLAEAIILLTPQ
jgi:hypothetical protein